MLATAINYVNFSGMWPLRVGPINTLNGMRDTEQVVSGDKGKKVFDNTLVMSFVEHTIVLTLTGEEVSKSCIVICYIYVAFTYQIQLY